MEHNPFKKNGSLSKSKKKLSILFETTAQRREKILIEEDITIKDLIKLYFDKINQPELYGDPNIRFLINANLLYQDSVELIKEYINKKQDVYKIIVDDLEDKIR